MYHGRPIGTKNQQASILYRKINKLYRVLKVFVAKKKKPSKGQDVRYTDGQKKARPLTNKWFFETFSAIIKKNLLVITFWERWQTMIWFLSTLFLILALGCFMLCPGKSTPQQRAPFEGVNFAHRGLHSKDKSVPENSLARQFRDMAGLVNQRVARAVDTVVVTMAGIPVQIKPGAGSGQGFGNGQPQ